MSEVKETNQAQQGSGQGELAQRLGNAHVALRNDLEVHRHIYRGQPQYIIRDPLTLKCCKLNQKDYTISTYIDDHITLAEVFKRLVADNILKSSEENGFYRFIVSMHQMTLLNLPIANDKSLYKKFRARQQARRNEKLMSFFFLKIPLFDPDAFLSKYCHLAGWLFTRWFFFVWLACMMIGGYIIAARHEELLLPVSQMFSPRNVVFMWFMLIALKVIHEFGHAFACKKFGGQVTEMGLFLIVLTPCAYVDVTSSWGFNRKLHRLIVGLGGMYFESIIAFAALLTWSLTDGLIAQQMAHNVFFLASLATVLMNINPLMRFDGYYLLSDMLEIPNLRQNAQDFTLSVIKRIFLGLPINSPHEGWKLRAGLLLFGISASIYRSVVVLSISILISMKAFMIGLAMAGFYIFSQLYKIVRNTTVYLWKAQESAPVRKRAIALSIILLSVIPAAIFFIPLPGSMKYMGQLTCTNETIVRVEQDGILEDIYARPGQAATAGIKLVSLSNSLLTDRYLELKTRAQKAQVEQDAASYQVNNDILSDQQRAYTRSVFSEFKMCEKDFNGLNICPETNGLIVAGLNHNNKGRHLKKGTPIATIISGNWVVKLLISEQDIAQSGIYAGQKAVFRSASYPGRDFAGRVTTISPQGKRDFDRPALTSLGTGDIAVNSNGEELTLPHYEITISLDDANNSTGLFRYGMTGTVKLGRPARAVGITLVNSVRRFLNSLDKQ
ncbi:MAG: HlyD family efflux transporter periplasmic adaptor subunit [Sedimentisphaerales bacterium]|nr:HlyD family efflux transporter periplasmic adaptor subunit [Sedimentisphaerales bacterium]MBN2841610.1 HlyD family efflux transporter periplasmic adaptor subunit [Sedimentisphaerales bacterium]